MEIFLNIPKIKTFIKDNTVKGFFQTLLYYVQNKFGNGAKNRNHKKWIDFTSSKKYLTQLSYPDF